MWSVANPLFTESHQPERAELKAVREHEHVAVPICTSVPTLLSYLFIVAHFECASSSHHTQNIMTQLGTYMHHYHHLSSFFCATRTGLQANIPIMLQDYVTAPLARFDMIFIPLISLFYVCQLAARGQQRLHSV